MKKTLLSLTFFCLALFTNAQSIYEKNLSAGISTLNSATTSEDFQKATNAFAKIIGTKEIDWLAYYYAALSVVKKEFFLQRQNLTSGIDHTTASAEKYLTPILKNKEKNSEINILLAQINYLKSLKNDSNKETYLKTANEYLKHAESLDQNNPRIDLVKGQMALESRKDEAKKYFNSAADKFTKYKTKPNAAPSWGIDDIQYYLTIIK